jgi:hypothetical protein
LTVEQVEIIVAGATVAAFVETLLAAEGQHARQSVTRVLTMKKPFGKYAGGLIRKDSRGDKTDIELFMAGVRGWEAAVRRRMTGEMPAKMH